MSEKQAELIDVSDLVGLIEIAERLGVSRTTVRQWRYRGYMEVEPVAIVSGTPIFSWQAVLAWAKKRWVVDPELDDLPPKRKRR